MHPPGASHSAPGGVVNRRSVPVRSRPAGSSAGKRDLCSLILAAGVGKRMQSRDTKLIHSIAGLPMVRHVVEATKAAGVSRTAVVIGSQAEDVRRAVGDGDKRIAFAYQKEQLGTGHAVLACERQLHGHVDDVLILNGDLPALRPETLRTFVEFHRSSGAPLSLVTATVPDPTGYGRIIRNYNSDLSRIVEETDATPEERATQEINCGIYCVDASHLFRPLKLATANNAQREIYLTDLVEILRKEGCRVTAYRHPEASEVLGVNDRREMATAAQSLYRRKVESLLRSGVSLIDPERTYIDVQVKVGRDTVIEPGVMLLGNTEIGEGARIGAGCHISDTTAGPGTRFLPYCVVAGARIGRNCRIGPFAHLRAETVLDEGARLGNFVETKKAHLGRGSKANHLTYIGDCEIGRQVNIGAGTITCNYDGIAKHRTVIEDDVFIGSDTQLVAPVRVRRGAFVGAGSTITRDVPAYSLALSRARQEIKELWAKRFGPAARRKDGRPAK